MKINVMRWLATAGAASFLALILADSASGQILPGKKAAKEPATPAAPAAPAAPRDAIKGVREAPGEVRREAREAGREAREDARDARQGARDFNRATRAADLGVWFNTRAAGGVANGLLIADLAADGVFTTAGFREGDRIVSINGQPITTEAQFVQLLTAPTREQITVVVFRDGQQQTITLQPSVLTEGVVTVDPFYQYGILIDDRNPNQIIVQRVYPRTPAYYAGLRAGDVITTLGGQRVANIEAFSRALQQADDTIALQVTRNGQAREFDLDASSGSVRTALRPNLDAQGQTDGRATAPGTRAAPTSPATPTSPAISPTPTRPTPPGTPTQPVPPGTPTSPSLQPRAPATTPGAAPPAAAPGAPAAAPGAPKAAPGAPAAPSAPATPAVPKAVPGTPAPPAAPRP